MYLNIVVVHGSLYDVHFPSDLRKYQGHGRLLFFSDTMAATPGGARALALGPRLGVIWWKGSGGGLQQALCPFEEPCLPSFSRMILRRRQSGP